ncbi:SIMPL domain-containing protein [Paracoccus jiaweipingae]|uniref:SIMPL domain-containing protein n=1 Tax=unclassified Paracoccus (in: a-proteobacteria) TaxID=2688777 RepID=UPI00379566FB
MNDFAPAALIRDPVPMETSTMFDPRKPALIALLSMAAVPAMAQQAPGTMPPAAYDHQAPARLTVTGMAEIRQAPDLAILSVGVSAQADTAQAAMADNAKRLSQVIGKLTEAGLQKADMQTAGLSLSPRQDYSQEGKPPRLVGYEARNMLVLRITDLDGLGAVLDSLVAAGANEINNIQFALKDPASVMDQARDAAVRDAIHRAGILAAAAGQKLGPVVSITEQGDSLSPPMPVMRAMAAEAGGATPIEAGEVAQQAAVQVVFGLMPDDADHKAIPQMGHQPEPGAADPAAGPATDAGADNAGTDVDTDTAPAN